MAPLPAPAEKPSHRIAESQSHAKLQPTSPSGSLLRRPLAESSTGVDTRIVSAPSAQDPQRSRGFHELQSEQTRQAGVAGMPTDGTTGLFGRLSFLRRRCV